MGCPELANEDLAENAAISLALIGTPYAIWALASEWEDWRAEYVDEVVYKVGRRSVPPILSVCREYLNELRTPWREEISLPAIPGRLLGMLVAIGHEAPTTRKRMEWLFRKCFRREFTVVWDSSEEPHGFDLARRWFPVRSDEYRSAKSLQIEAY
jgi:hypothetical protein